MRWAGAVLMLLRLVEQVTRFDRPQIPRPHPQHLRSTRVQPRQRVGPLCRSAPTPQPVKKLGHLRTCVRRAMIGAMLRAHDIEGLRRSNAMAPLSQSHVSELIESCAAMAREREQIRIVLAELSSPFGDVRRALNEMQRILGG